MANPLDPKGYNIGIRGAKLVESETMYPKTFMFMAGLGPII